MSVPLVTSGPGGGILRSPREREKELTLDIGAHGRYTAQLTWSSARTRDFAWFAPVPPGPLTHNWTNIGTVDRTSVEALVTADLLRRQHIAWTATLMLDRGRQRVSDFARAPFIDFGSGMLFRDGAVFGQVIGYRWLRSHGELPSLHAMSHDAFVVNDDGLLVAVGPGGSIGDRQYGTVVTIDGQSYDWGYPVVARDEDGVPWTTIADLNPDLGIGLGTSLRWRAVTFSAVLSGQIGGHGYDHLRQLAYLRLIHADVDQSAKPTEFRKPVDYYHRFAGDMPRNDRFVGGATHLRVREIAVAFDVPRMPALSISLVGRNLVTWTRYRGITPEALFPTLNPEGQAASQDLRYPEARSIALYARLGLGG